MKRTIVGLGLILGAIAIVATPTDHLLPTQSVEATRERLLPFEQSFEPIEVAERLAEKPPQPASTDAALPSQGRTTVAAAGQVKSPAAAAVALPTASIAAPAVRTVAPPSPSSGAASASVTPPQTGGQVLPGGSNVTDIPKSQNRLTAAKTSSRQSQSALAETSIGRTVARAGGSRGHAIGQGRFDARGIGAATYARQASLIQAAPAPRMQPPPRIQW